MLLYSGTEGVVPSHAADYSVTWLEVSVSPQRVDDNTARRNRRIHVPHPEGPTWAVDGDTIYIPIDTLPEATQEYILGALEVLPRIGKSLRPYLARGLHFETLEEFSAFWEAERAAAAAPAGKPRRKKHSNYAKTFLALGRRDGFHCQHCHATKDIHIDHIIPVACGGIDALPNMQLLCQRCNARKGKR